ncbi:transcriptional regulator, LysR family [Noviherbaspirillum humi]|uniref:Transcriptional regulator, LysR family n=1 Tax=Noviherbaspirillum humi TaxID=1688639 RepID=A0A239JNT7_9BURK|nr:LysR family transcriptional regulator [Noviherbaspirillum humi]SNT07495.1 transcriptional regulator, LysR family [Noviherbaspirillum humi]
MDLKQLEYFVRVAEFGSFSRASMVLNIAQPALSRQIRALEVEFRQTLLIRNGRGVTMTEAGRLLLSHSLGVLQQVEHLKNALEEQRGSIVGRVVVGMPPSVGRILAVATVKEFQRRYPNAVLSVVEGLSVHIMEWLQVGKVDLGLVYNPNSAPTMEIVPLIEEDLFLMAPKPRRTAGLKLGKPVTQAALADYPLVIPSRPHAIRMLVETRLADAGLKINVRSEVDSVPAILDLVAQGLGFAVLPLNAVHSNQMDALIQPRPITAPRMTSLLAIAKSHQRPASPLVFHTGQLIEQLAKSQAVQGGAKVLLPGQAAH